MAQRYRHGVLIENYVEDQFGIDLLSRQVNEKTPLTNFQATHSLNNTILSVKKVEKDPKCEEYKKEVVFSNNGQKAHILFGHGIHQINDFERNEYKTIQDLSYNNKLPSKTQVNSFFEPNSVKQKKDFQFITCPDKMQKTYLKNIPLIGGQAEFTDTRARTDVYKPYDKYTKTFDVPERNTMLRDGSYC